MELKDRIQAETPRWFKKIIKLGIMLAAAGLTVKVTAGTMDDFTLNAVGTAIVNYMIITGAVAAAVAKTAKEHCEDDDIK